MQFLKRSQEQEPSIALTPLVDIVFLLIIFFLVSSTFETGEKELDIHLPATKGGVKTQRETKNHYFNILPSGTVVFQGQTMGMDEIEAFLKEKASDSEGHKFTVRADEKSPYGYFAKLMGLFNAYGFEKVAIQTVHDKE